MSANRLSGEGSAPKRTSSYVVALLFSAALIAACFGLKEWAWWRLDCCWIDQSEIAQWQSLVLTIASVWAKLWWLFSPVLVVLFLVCAYFYEMVREVRPK